MSRTEFRFSGFGGQGVITMCHVLGKAASIYDDMNATMTEAYGPEKTGGFSRGDLVINRDKIGYPNVMDPDIVVVFSQDAFERDADTVTHNGRVLTERDLVNPKPLRDDRSDIDIIELPVVEKAEDLGLKVVANIVMLGATVDLAGIPNTNTVREAIRETVPEGTENLNIEAFESGLNLLDDAKTKSEVIE